MGDFKIYYMDCIKGLKKHVKTRSIHLHYTSPPYFNAKEYDSNAHEDSLGNYQDLELWLDSMESLFEDLYRTNTEGGYFGLNVSYLRDSETSEIIHVPAKLIARAQNAGYRLMEEIYWVKPTGAFGNPAMKRGGVFIQNPYPTYWKANEHTEFILYFRKGNRRKLSSEEKKLSGFSKAQAVGIIKRGQLLYVPPEQAARTGHPAAFPIGLPKHAIKLHTIKGDWVCDPFLGTGTTMLAALKSGRNCIGFEISKEYAKKAIKRCGFRHEMMHGSFELIK